MFSNELNPGDLKQRIEKKLSREDRKNLDAVRIMQKEEENSQQRATQKNKIHQKPPPPVSEPRKQPKIQHPKPYGRDSPGALLEEASNSISQTAKHVDEEKPKEPPTVINPSYKLTTQDDLFRHLINYRQTQREKLVQKNNKSLKGLPYPESKEDILLITEDMMHSTVKAYSRIQSKFQDNRSKLRKPNAKEHKDFVNQEFLRN